MTKDIYCTYLTVYSGSKLPPLYIGSTSIDKINKGYRGSVLSNKYKEIWESELAENPHLFETKILTTHSTREEAFEEEIRYQIEHDVVKSAEYINMAVANGKLMFSYYDDPDYRKKLSESRKGKKRGPYKERSEEAKKRNLESWTDERRKKHSESRKGKTKTEEQKKKMSEAHKKRYENPEERKKTSEATKNGLTEEARKKHSEAQKKRWNM